MRVTVLALTLALVGVANMARADDKTVRARAHSEAGRALYSIGDYDAALREFVIGYQLVPKPQFLVNLGQTYRKLGQIDKAREMYGKYLTEAPEDDPHRASVLQILGELDHEAPVAQQVRITPPPTAPIAVVAGPELRRFNRRHLGWILPTTALVLAGVAVGVYFGVRPSDGCQPGLACIDSTHRAP